MPLATHEVTTPLVVNFIVMLSLLMVTPLVFSSSVRGVLALATAGSVVLRNLPANCTAVGVPAEVVRINNKAVNPADDLDQQDLPDIVSQRLTDLDRRLSQLEKTAQGDIPPTAAQIAARQRK